MKPKPKSPKQTPTISMRAFFELPEVVACQQTQMQNEWGSPLHKRAHDRILEIAKSYHADSYFSDY